MEKRELKKNQLLFVGSPGSCAPDSTRNRYIRSNIFSEMDSLELEGLILDIIA
jgi:GTPase Era involved in 16S rRNA processing